MLRKAVKKESREDVTQAGDYCLLEREPDNRIWAILFICPHEGCGDKSHVPLAPVVERGWNWNESATTLSPSIQRKDPSRCEHHFSLINGVWIP